MKKTVNAKCQNHYSLQWQWVNE